MCPSSSVVERFHGKEEVQGSIPCLGSTQLKRQTSIKRLQLSQTNRKITGLCGGLGEYFKVDPTIIRVIWLVATILTGLLPGVLIYLVASVITPRKGTIHAQT